MKTVSGVLRDVLNFCTDMKALFKIRDFEVFIIDGCFAALINGENIS